MLAFIENPAHDESLEQLLCHQYARQALLEQCESASGIVLSEKTAELSQIEQRLKQLLGDSTVEHWDLFRAIHPQLMSAVMTYLEAKQYLLRRPFDYFVKKKITLDDGSTQFEETFVLDSVMRFLDQNLASALTKIAAFWQLFQSETVASSVMHLISDEISPQT